MSLWRRVPAPPSSARAFSTSSRGTWAVGTPGGLFLGLAATPGALGLVDPAGRLFWGLSGAL